MKETSARIGAHLSNRYGEMYIDKAVGLIISVVVGSLLLTGLYELFNHTILPGLAERIQTMFGA